MRVNGKETSLPVNFPYGAYVDHKEVVPELKYGTKPTEVIIRKVESVIEKTEYKRYIKINTYDALDNYPVKITLDTTDLISDGKVNVDGSDIRIYKDGIQLPIWINTATFGTAQTDIWTKLTMDPGEDLLIMYYGNKLLEAVSDGTAVFPTFDDFTISDDNWTTTDYWYIVGDEFYHSSITSNPYTSSAFITPTLTDYELETSVKLVNTGYVASEQGINIAPVYIDDNNFIALSVRPDYHNGVLIRYLAADAFYQFNDNVVSYNTFYTITVKKSGNSIKLICDALELDMEYECEFASTQLAFINLSGDVYYDYLLVKPITENEPIITVYNEV
ncbi:hypothetical protein HNP86_001871 [Methanococcus maripaludis]|uniref:DUF2341 domain-containing protein n=1 Tax=Methanococcus maripaludis TaxID=39152 RepID=A0A7J9NVK5_METMI|nr:DUF2341 domain-containing protein [Methanococcus maripaludis]MBA2851712.1 hypothetical protein [Methanococcus maripaludis]